eukprot:3468370-Karenia_brevis.AAC.1
MKSRRQRTAGQQESIWCLAVYHGVTPLHAGRAVWRGASKITAERFPLRSIFPPQKGFRSVMQRFCQNAIGQN